MVSHQALIQRISQRRVVDLSEGKRTMFFIVWTGSKHGLTAYAYTVRP